MAANVPAAGRRWLVHRPAKTLAIMAKSRRMHAVRLQSNGQRQRCLSGMRCESMKRYARIRVLARRMTLFICASISVSAGVLCIASYCRSIVVLRPPMVGFWEDLQRDAHHDVTIKAQNGVLVVLYRDRITKWRWTTGFGPLTKYEFGGFKYSDRMSWLRVYTFRSIDICIPLWLPFVFFGVYPLIAYMRGPVRHRRRRKRNQCIHCGYNLTGLTEPRCPECGEQS